jgi:cell division protein FtsI/penicillin-binding protein 2
MSRRRTRGRRQAGHPATANRRIRLLVLVFVLVFAGALARAGWLQAVRGPELDRLADGQQQETISVPAHRGTIYDRNGVELALGRRATTIYANPRQIRDPRSAAIAVGQALGVEPGLFVGRLADRSKGFVYLARKADPARAELLRRRGIVGLGFYPEEQRAYPHGEVAAEVLGFAGLDNKGLAGLELQLDEVLGGRDGEKTIVRDPFGRTLDVVASRPSREGRDVTLTLDHVLQGEVERVLRETRRRWQAQSATAVVLDPRTGGVLATATEPGFDANRFPEVPVERTRNRAVTDTFEPGSTLKVVTVAAELQRGDVTPDTKFRLPPSIQVADRVINEHDSRPTMWMTVSDIIAYSSNVGTITLALRLGPDRLAEWIERFGFGRKTGIEFPGETAGIVPPVAEWSGSTIGTLPIGHGIAVTPMQMAAAYAAVANGGVWIEPHLVDRIAGTGPVNVERRRILSRKTANTVRKMLSRVVREGTGTEAQIPGYSIAGKTGTAAKPEPSGGYSKSRYVGSFVGFVPAKDPRLVILVTVDEPRGSIWGGVVAAPAFAEIAQFALQYLEIPPDRPLELAVE